jgi:predicted CXXCH cytochrome family protein
VSRHALALLALLLATLAACAGILGIRNQTQQAFPHRAHVIQGVACVQCHKTVARSEAAAALDLPGPDLCRQCHSPAHDSRPCGQCHGREEERRNVAQAKEHLLFSHRDHTRTAAGGCTRCHDAVLTHDAPLRPTMATCLSCHEHRQAWNSQACSPCHRDMASEGTRPQSHMVHGRDFLKRHGFEAASARELCSSCHAESECASCHGANVPALPSIWHFDDVKRPDMHGAGFLARHSIEARLDPALCTSCHRDESGCQSCHQQRGLLEVSATRGSPHPPGWVGTRGSSNRHGIEARANPVLCASCHGGAGESLCVGCHRVGGPGGNPHPNRFVSHKPMSELPCRLCHMGGL